MRPLGPHLSHRVGDVSGDLLRVGFPGSGDRGAAVDQRVEPLLPLVLAKRTGTSPSQPLGRVSWIMAVGCGRSDQCLIAMI